MAATYALNGRKGMKPDFDLVYEYFPRLYERRNGLAGYLSGGEQQMLAIGRALIAKPKLILLDEPSLGLAPLLVENIFQIIARINAEQGVSMLLVEQNASIALAISHYGYIMEMGKIVTDGSAEFLSNDPDVREFYLGVGGGGEAKSFKNIKHYKRRRLVIIIMSHHLISNLTLPQMLVNVRSKNLIKWRCIKRLDWQPLTWVITINAAWFGLGMKSLVCLPKVMWPLFLKIVKSGFSTRLWPG